MNLSNDQKKVLTYVKMWWGTEKYSRPFIFSGCAGSGKTSLIKYIVEELSCRVPAFMSFTGKAAQVLQSKGYSPSRTIHSTLYKCWEDQKKKLHFSLRSYEEIASEGFDLFIVDECSMLTTELIHDIQSFGIPVIFIGDHNQLDPIGEIQNELMKNADIRIEEPLRQQKDNEIIRISQEIIKGTWFPEYGKGKDVEVIKFATAERLMEFDQIICGYNRTRKRVNNDLRKNRFEFWPRIGDKMISRKNDWNKSVVSDIGKVYITNGLIGYAQNDVDYIGREIEFRPDIQGAATITMKMNEYFLQTGGELNPSEGIPRDERGNLYLYADYAYAITCHSAQGSEFDNVGIIVEPIGRTREIKQRWMYTAITRAKKKATLIIS